MCPCPGVGRAKKGHILQPWSALGRIWWRPWGWLGWCRDRRYGVALSEPCPSTSPVRGSAAYLGTVICHVGGAPCPLSTVQSPSHPPLIPCPLSGSPASQQETLGRSDPFPSFIPCLVSVNFFCPSLNFARPRSVICCSSSPHVQPHHGPVPAASYLGNLCPVQPLLLGLLSCSCLVAALLSTWPPCSSPQGLRLKATF